MKKQNKLLLLSFMLWGAWHLAKHSGEKKKNEVKTEINNYNMERKKKVWMFFKESTSHLRKDSSCLLLKYINSVLVLHLQLEPKKEK